MHLNETKYPGPRLLRRHLDLALAHVYAQVEERPWGLLVYNPSNPYHHDANSARITRAVEPDQVIQEIVGFYHAHGIVPRVKLDDVTEPPDLAVRLAEHGFTCDSGIIRFMRWVSTDHRVVPIPDDVSIEVASTAESDAIARIQLAANEYPGWEWMANKISYEAAAPNVRLYLVRVNDRPAACAAVLQLTDIALIEDVATLPSLQRHGLATLLIEHIQSMATTPLVLEVVAENAERIYMRAGFRVWAEIKETTCVLEP